jgi:CO/xanthine dehydrogenase FAD-binding subunit
MPVAELFVTYLTTSLEADEVVTEVLMPIARNCQGFSFQEMVRRSSDLAIVAVAARVERDESTGAVASVGVSLAGVADRVCLADPEPLQELVGSPGDDGTFRRVAAGVAAGVQAESDLHASGAYRKRLVEVLTRRALRDAFDRAAPRAGAA